MRLLLAVLAFSVSLFAQEIVPGRYLVQLKTKPAIFAAERNQRLNQIQGERVLLMQALSERKARVVAAIDNIVNVLVVEADSIDTLRSLPGVKRVEPVRNLHVFLYRAIPLHHVDEAWNQIGGIANAGAGIKIGIVDTGIDPTHPGFQPAEGMTMPEGYPKFDTDANQAITSTKIIAARSYDQYPALDTYGHGTGVAMAAAGVRHQSPAGAISGVSPQAWLGVYRASDVASGSLPTDYILRALSDAVSDGMDVINMSFGSVGATGASQDQIYSEAVKAVLDAGIIVVAAAGNTAGPMTVDDTASAERVIAVGANQSDGGSQTAVVPSQGDAMPALASSNVGVLDPISGPLSDVRAFDASGLGCAPYPDGSLVGLIPLIQRGGCYFQEKLAFAAAAGAQAAIVFNGPDYSDPDGLIAMNVDGNPTIPGLFIGYTDGTKLQNFMGVVEDFTVQLRFPQPLRAPTSLASFSSGGPSVELAIKPDLVATGNPFYTAAAIGPTTSSCPLCSPTGYVTTAGTSFSSPLVAGSAALIKAARPGLTLDDYRSLLINSASPMVLADGTTAAVQSAGAGYLNVANALNTTIAAAPVSLSYGAVDGTVDLTRDVTFKNVGSQTTEYTLTVDSIDGVVPTLSSSTISLDPGATGTVTLALSGGGLTAGTYQGFLHAADPNTNSMATIPYWFAVKGGAPAAIEILYEPDAGYAGRTVSVYLRVHDIAGLAITNPAPVIEPVYPPAAVGSVQEIIDDSAEYPGVWKATLVLSRVRGYNIFRVHVDGVDDQYIQIQGF